MSKSKAAITRDTGDVEDRQTGEVSYYATKILHSSEIYLAEVPADEEYARSELVVVPSKYGKDIGKILGPVRSIDGYEKDEIVGIIRRATERDMDIHRDNKERERAAVEICKEKIEDRGLAMKVVSAHYLPEEKKILFFFTAESRVDFRELVKDLVSVFKMRIELRQIGVRDESRVIGGLAVCGRSYCCHGITDRLKSVSIKMAKEQNLSLNSMKISGPCGRLLCCLSYEFDFYRDEKRRFPPEGSRHTYKDIHLKVTETNVFNQSVVLSASDGRYIELPLSAFSYDEKKKSWRVLHLDEE